MSIGKNREEQELTKLLARTLVQKEVIEPMTAIGWSHASPPPPDYTTTVPTEGAPASAPGSPAAPVSGQPAGSPAAPAAPVAPAKADTPVAPADIVSMFESLRDTDGLIMGKYKTVPEALKGAGHLATMAKQSFQERDAALKQLREVQELGARPQPVATPASAPVTMPASLTASRASLKQAEDALTKVLASVEEDGNVLDAETLRKVGNAQREVAELAADVRVQENLHQRESVEVAERNRWNAVDEHMRVNFPDSLKLSDEIGLHIQSDPVLQEAVAALCAAGKEVQASVLAWKSYERSVSDGSALVVKAAAENKEEDLKAKEQVRQELLEKARIDAGIIKGAAGGQGIHENLNAGVSSREELAALTNQMRMEGDAPGTPAAVKFRHQIIGRHLDPSIFGGQ
jgi:hypothetical protein